jgi:hypothetical protein
MINYVTLREHLWQATGGRIDLFADERVRNAGCRIVRIEMADGCYPPIADCRAGPCRPRRFSALSLARGSGCTATRRHGTR